MSWCRSFFNFNFSHHGCLLVALQSSWRFSDFSFGPWWNGTWTWYLHFISFLFWFVAEYLQVNEIYISFIHSFDHLDSISPVHQSCVTVLWPRLTVECHSCRIVEGKPSSSHGHSTWSIWLTQWSYIFHSELLLLKHDLVIVP